MDPLLIHIFELLGYNIISGDDLCVITLPYDNLKNKELINKLYSTIPEAKKKYKSSVVTCLHKNSIEKQKYPAINFIRQILKCNGYKLNGYYTYNGYHKANGNKNIKRFYKIIKL